MGTAPHTRYRIGPFTLDAADRVLLRDGREVALRGKSFNTLLRLVEQRSHLATKHELLAHVWPDVAVSEAVLTHCIAEIRQALGDDPHEPRFIRTVSGLGYKFIALVEVIDDEEWAPTPGQRRAAPGVVRLVVFPLENLSGDPGQDYLAAGITEELTTRLACLAPERLHVLARTTGAHCAAHRERVQAIGRELDVDYVIEGSARRAGDRVRITAQLVRTADETHVWARSYEAEVRDVLMVEGELAEAIAREIGRAISPAGASPDPGHEAYDAYLRGVFHTRRANEPGAWDAAIGCFREATNRDPGFARAWAALANCHASLAFWGLTPATVSMPIARDEARRAVDLAPESWEAQTALGTVQWFADWDLDAAERSFRLAVALAPGESRARYGLSQFLGAMRGAWAEGHAELQQALDLDPLSPVLRVAVAWIHHWCGHLDEAVTHCRGLLGREPGLLQALYVLGLAESARGNHDEAVTAFRQARALCGDAFSIGYLAMATGRAGRPDEARAILAELDTRARSAYVSPVCFLWAQVGVGNPDAIVAALDRLIEERDPHVLWVPFSPTYRPVREDPRFASFLARLPALPGPA